MIAQQNDYLQEASKAYYKLTQEERIRQICEAREDYYRCQHDMQQIMDEQAAALKEKENALKEQADALAEKDALIASLLEQLENKQPSSRLPHGRKSK